MAYLSYSYVHKFIPRGYGNYWTIPKVLRKKAYNAQTMYHERVKPQLTVWYQICDFVDKNPGCSRGDIQEHLGYSRKSHCMCDLYTTMLSDSVLIKERDDRPGKRRGYRYYISTRGEVCMRNADRCAEFDIKQIEKSNLTRFKSEEEMQHAAQKVIARKEAKKFRQKIK